MRENAKAPAKATNDEASTDDARVLRALVVLEQLAAAG
jgi:hypothetical protein